MFPIHQGNRDHHYGLTLKGFQYFRSVSQKKYLHSTTSDSGIISHQTATKRDYLLDIFTSIIFYTTEGITKASATKQSGNWEIWYTLLTHTGITKYFLYGIPQGEKTIVVLSFAASVQRNSLAQQVNPNSSTEPSKPPYWMYLYHYGRTFGATPP